MSTIDRVLGNLRTSVLGSQRPRIRSRNLLDDANLFESQNRAAVAQQTAVSAALTVGATAQEQRTAVEAVAERTAILVTHGRDMRGAADQVRESLDRIKLVGLNAALEGARIGEPAGAALVTIGEEVRTLVVKALDSFNEHRNLLAQAETERERLIREIEQARRTAATLADEMLRAQSAQRDARDRVEDLGEEIRRATGTDPEVAKSVSEAAEHARGLLEALSSLSSKTQGTLASRSLWPTIEPLLRVIRDLRPESARDPGK